MSQEQPARNDPAPSLPPGPPAAGYQVVARRYRPQRFDELVGQEHVARGLSGAIESGRIGHAYLFTGARGVGKTSAARIYAKALECTARAGAEPCNACEKCLAIAAGQDVDVVEVDAASNRGIDEIRQLRQNVAVRPARGRYKIYIIDEVHMLTREAFNALLKTLEEPPAHVKFVLCTTEPEKLPITILSRCQRFDFQTVDAGAIARRLEQIVAAEGAEVTAEALALIARRAAGSMRDSQSLLEQLLGSAAGPIGVDEVHAVIGTGREEVVGRLVAAVVGRDARAALECLDLALAGGADPGGVLEQVLAAFRDALVASVGCGPETMQQGPGIGVDLAAVGRSTGTVTLLAMLQIVDQSLARMRSSGHARVLAEMAVVRLSALEDLDDLAAAVERVAANASAAPSGVSPARSVSAPAAVPQAAGPAAPPAAAAAPREKKTADVTMDPGRPAPVHSPAPVSPTATVLPGAAVPPVATAESPAGAAADGSDAAVVSGSAAGVPAGVTPAIAAADAWLRASESVGGLAADFAALTTAVAWRDDVIEVVLPASATSSAAFLRRPEVAAGLSRAVSDLAGRTVRLALVVEQPAAGAAARAATSAERPRPATSQAALVRETADHPLVAHARAVFDAAIRKVEPARGPRPAAPAVVATPAAGGGAGLAAAEDELDHAADEGADEPPFDGE
jgi:DNA polymerase III subunit gamma/tau